MKNLSRRSFLSLAGITSLAMAACSGGGDGTSANSSSTQDSPDSAQAEEPGKIVGGVLVTPYDEGYSSGIHHATIEVKDFGTIKLELNATNTPITVSNFAHLVNEKFYDGLTFHRIVKGFVIQGGDPNGDGSGGSNINIKGEFSENGIVNAIQHKRGVISMARSSQKNDSASSQFFIVIYDSESTENLDGSYAAFGKVTEGMDVVDKIAEVPLGEGTDASGTLDKTDQPVITSIVMDD